MRPLGHHAFVASAGAPVHAASSRLRRRTVAPQNTVVKIIPNDKGNPGKLADVEIHFVDGVFAGHKLIGFATWGAVPAPVAAPRFPPGSTP
jgi:hypothetical protein